MGGSVRLCPGRFQIRLTRPSSFLRCNELSNGDRNNHFLVAKRFDEEFAASSCATLNGHVHGASALRDNDFWHDHAIRYICSDVDEQAVPWSCPVDAERNRLALAL